MQSERLTLTPKQEQHTTGREEQEQTVKDICERVSSLERPKRRVTWNELLGWTEVE